MTLPGWKNKLYFGDNLDILREHVASETVDLIYLKAFPFSKTEEKWEAKIKAIDEGKPVKSSMKLGELAHILGWAKDRVGRVLRELVELEALHKAKNGSYFVRFM